MLPGALKQTKRLFGIHPLSYIKPGNLLYYWQVPWSFWNHPDLGKQWDGSGAHFKTKSRNVSKHPTRNIQYLSVFSERVMEATVVSQYKTTAEFPKKRKLHTFVHSWLALISGLDKEFFLGVQGWLVGEGAQSLFSPFTDALTLGHMNTLGGWTPTQLGWIRGWGQWAGEGTSNPKKSASLLVTGGPLCTLVHYACITTTEVISFLSRPWQMKKTQTAVCRHYRAKGTRLKH